jgi:hypothetical protein
VLGILFMVSSKGVSGSGQRQFEMDGQTAEWFLSSSDSGDCTDAA